MLKAEYLSTPTSEIAARLGCRTHNIIARAKILGLSRSKEPIWRPEELRRLRTNYPVLGQVETAKLFPGRTLEGVRIKAVRMGIRIGSPSSETDPARLSVYQAAKACNVDREVILRLAVRDQVLERRGRFQTVPEAWLETVRREYPHGSIDLKNTGYLSLKRAAPLIGVERRTLERAVNRGHHGPVRTALEGIALYRVGKCTYLHPDDVSHVKARLLARHDKPRTVMQGAP